MRDGEDGEPDRKRDRAEEEAEEERHRLVSPTSFSLVRKTKTSISCWTSSGSQSVFVPDGCL